MARAQTGSPGAIVRLEVRLGAAPPAVYEVGDGGFLIGSVPGCDLRLPGPNLPPVVCLIARHATGASLRKLAPVLPIAVNGRPVSSTYLDDGNKLSVGPVELVVRITPSEDEPALDEAELNERQRQLAEKERELEAARIHWHHRQEEIEAACKRRMEEVEARAAEMREQAPLLVQQQLDGRSEELDAREETLRQQQAEVETLRHELTGIRKDLSERYQQRRERLLTQQQAIHRVARKMKNRKAGLDEREARITTLEQQSALERAEVEASQEQIDREKQLVEEQHRLFASRQQEVQRDLHQRVADLEVREASLTAEKAALEKGQKQHQADLVRLDRIQAGIEQRQKALEQRALEIDRKFEQMQRDSRDLEEQATQLDDWHNRLSAESEQLQARKSEVDAVTGQLDQRASALEGQQTMLTTLRTRLERMREELHRQEQALSDQRVLQEASEADLATRLEDAERERIDLANDRQLINEERRRFDERRQTLDQAVASLRLTQAKLEAEQAELQSRQQKIDATAQAQTEQANLFLVRGEQLEQVNVKLQAERQLLQERMATLTKAEQTLATLQEQVRKRVEELEGRQGRLLAGEEELERKHEELNAWHAEMERLHQQTAADLDTVRQELSGRAQTLEQHGAELRRRQEDLGAAYARFEEVEQSLQGQRQALATDRVSFEVERQVAQEQDRIAREEFQKVREEGQTLSRLVPELELRATAALERLTRSREQLREHLAQIHAYAQQSRDDLEAARKQVQADVERVRQQELDLEVARDEHRLAVAAFRQQLIDWQGRVGEMRQSLQVGTTQLEMRQAAIDQQARQVADSTARLAAETEQLELAKHKVAERRGVMDRHLSDMQEWYRVKLRDLAGVDVPAGVEPGEGDVVPMPTPAAGAARGDVDERSPARAVLTLNDEIEPADRQLGELLATQGLVDEDTLQALWADARRQRRSLRQLLLAGGYLTLYQMALIEAGNLDGLVLGPVRIIDKLSSNPREAVYRVFDPRRNTEALLRHLAEGEMHDAVHPDEFQQRFAAAAAVKHGNVQAVLEVLEITGRPAALIEWIHGVSAADWSGLVAAPGVWYRLTCQAAVALQAAHAAGMCHGHLDAGSFVLTGEGTLKLVGLGEPGWLAAVESEEPESPAADLLALGRVVADWAARTPTGKGAKAKPLPAELQALLSRLSGAEVEGRYQTAKALVEDLEKAGAKAPATTTAWDRLLKQVREQVTQQRLRESA